MGISKNLIEAVVVCEKSSDSDSFILRNCNFIAMNFLAQINVDYPGRRPQAPACFKSTQRIQQTSNVRNWTDLHL